jgi:glycosyltransferase involved in cell wall biosynthesis
MRRRVLFVTQQLPWPKDSGGNIRTFFMLAGLARRFDVVLCSTRDASPGAREGERVLGELCAALRLVPDVKRRGALGMAGGVLRSLVRGVPAVLLHNANPALRDVVRGELARGGIDSLHINHLDTAPYFDLAASPPSVIDTHNLLFEYYARRAEVERGVLRRWVCAREARLLARQEPALLRAARRVVVCSRTEAESLARLDAELDVRVVPNGVDCAAFQPRVAPPAAANCDLVFVGDLAYGPNQDAALRFAVEVLPLVQREEPAARFLAVGKNPSAQLVALGRSREDVVVTGFVEDVRQWVHGARVYVVPIRYGSGTRLKVLEAFALGMPTVSTRIGAEGIETREGEDILLRDEPEEMASAIVRLLRDPELAARLARNARATVERSYDWPALGERLADVHAELH